MSCGSRYYEENPLHDAKLEALAAETNRVAAQKIAAFFISIVDACNVQVTQGGQHRGADRVHLTLGERLLVQHRGYTVSVVTSDAPATAEQFKAWCREEMTHVRVKMA